MSRAPEPQGGQTGFLRAGWTAADGCVLFPSRDGPPCCGKPATHLVVAACEHEHLVPVPCCLDCGTWLVLSCGQGLIACTRCARVTGDDRVRVTARVVPWDPAGPLPGWAPLAG